MAFFQFSATHRLPVYTKNSNLTFRQATELPDDCRAIVDAIWNFKQEGKLNLCNCTVLCFNHMLKQINSGVNNYWKTIIEQQRARLDNYENLLRQKDKYIKDILSPETKFYDGDYETEKAIMINRFTHRTASSFQFLPIDIVNNIRQRYYNSLNDTFDILQDFLEDASVVPIKGLTVTCDVNIGPIEIDPETEKRKVQVDFYVRRAVIHEMFYTPVQYKHLTITPQLLMGYGLLAAVRFSDPDQVNLYGRKLATAVLSLMANTGNFVWIFIKSIPPALEERSFRVTPAFHKIWVQLNEIDMPFINERVTCLGTTMPAWRTYMLSTNCTGICGTHPNTEPVFLYQWIPDPLPIFAESYYQKIYRIKLEDDQCSEVPFNYFGDRQVDSTVYNFAVDHMLEKLEEKYKVMMSDEGPSVLPDQESED